MSSIKTRGWWAQNFAKYVHIFAIKQAQLTGQIAKQCKPPLAGTRQILLSA